MKITAAVLRDAGGPFQLEELTLADPAPGQVRVRIVGVGFCHTDLLPRTGVTAPPPLVAGHEGAGVVEAVGDGVTDIAVDDHVVLSYDHCGDCDNCRTGRQPYCETFFARNLVGVDGNAPAIAHDAAGRPVAARWFGQSSFATHSVCDARNVVKVDPGLPLELLGPLACSVQTGAGAVFNSLEVAPQSAIAIFGAGAVGLSAVMAARAAGAGAIVVADLNAARLAVAEELGATHTIDSSAEDASRRLRALRGVHHSLDTTGVPEVIGAAIKALRPGGVCGLVGAQRGTLHVDPMLLSVGKTVKGIIEGDAVPRTFIPRLISLWQDGTFPFDRLITTFPLAEINSAERAAASGRVIKPVLLPGTGTQP